MAVSAQNAGKSAMKGISGMAASAQYAGKSAVKGIIGMAANAQYAGKPVMKGMSGICAKVFVRFAVRRACRNMIGMEMFADAAE